MSSTPRATRGRVLIAASLVDDLRETSFPKDSPSAYHAIDADAVVKQTGRHRSHVAYIDRADAAELLAYLVSVVELRGSMSAEEKSGARVSREKTVIRHIRAAFEGIDEDVALLDAEPETARDDAVDGTPLVFGDRVRVRGLLGARGTVESIEYDADGTGKIGVRFFDGSGGSYFAGDVEYIGPERS